MHYKTYRFAKYLQCLAFFLKLFSAISTLCTVSACYKHVNIAAAVGVVVVVAAAAVAAFDFNNVSHFVAFVAQDKCQRQGKQSEKVTGTASSAEE